MSQLCAVCGAPRTTTDPACSFCRTLFASTPAVAASPLDPSAAAVAAGWPPALIAALDADNLIGAIKIYRETYKTSLKEAKAACDSLVAARRR
jgi:ribosomal protein L7/L12